MANMHIQSAFNPTNDTCRSGSSIDFSVLTEINQITAISAEWDDLLAQSRCNLTFNCSQWYLATVELHPKLQPLVFTARREGILSGILPLWLDVNEKLARIGDDFIDHSDIIAKDDDSDVMTGLLDLALQGEGSYSGLDLGQVKRDSNYVTAARLLGLDDVVDELFLTDKCLIYAVLDLTPGYDAYIKTLGRRFRSSLHCDYKRAEREGLLLQELTPAELEPAQFPEMFLSLHLSRFGDRSALKSSSSWIQRLFPALFAERRLRVFAAVDKGRVVGIDTATVTRSGMYGMIGGFLPEMSRYALGKLLIHKAIQQVCLEGMAEYDLGWWRQEYKGHWRPVKREVARLRLPTYSESHKRSRATTKAGS